MSFLALLDEQGVRLLDCIPDCVIGFEVVIRVQYSVMS